VPGSAPKRFIGIFFRFNYLSQLKCPYWVSIHEVRERQTKLFADIIFFWEHLYDITIICIVCCVCQKVSTCSTKHSWFWLKEPRKLLWQDIFCQMCILCYGRLMLKFFSQECGYMFNITFNTITHRVTTNFSNTNAIKWLWYNSESETHTSIKLCHLKRIYVIIHKRYKTQFTGATAGVVSLRAGPATGNSMMYCPNQAFSCMIIQFIKPVTKFSLLIFTKFFLFVCSIG